MKKLTIENNETEHDKTKSLHDALFKAQRKADLYLYKSFPDIAFENEDPPTTLIIEKCKESLNNQENANYNQFKKNSEILIIKTIEAATEHMDTAENEYSNENREAAWSLLCEAIFLIGDLQSEAPFDKEQYHVERGRSGGNARSAKMQPAKDKARELLRVKKPESGWNSTAEASNAIVDDLAKFVKGKSINLSPFSLLNTLRRWLKEDQQLIAAFDETKKN